MLGLINTEVTLSTPRPHQILLPSKLIPYFCMTAISFCSESSFPFRDFLSTTFMATFSPVFLLMALYTSEKAPLRIRTMFWIIGIERANTTNFPRISFRLYLAVTLASCFEPKRGMLSK